MKIAVLLSGGVDSSVAIHALLAAGHRDVTAFYIKVWLEDEVAFPGACPWEEDVTFARSVCDAAGVPLEIISLQREYHDRVVDYALAELRAGRTPSPDLFCNQRIKFGAFRDAVGPSFERIASGHYARIDERDGAPHLLRGVDPVKDQTYFLAHVERAQLARCLFPLGALTKSEVRGRAVELDLPTQARPDSQGICFLGRIRYTDFVRARLGERPGPIVEQETGRRLGEHRGHWFHTIGQRKGLGLSLGPWYVIGKDPEADVVYVSHARAVDTHTRREFATAAPHWILGPPTHGRLGVKLRHSEHVYTADVECRDSSCRVCLDELDRGIAPGQFSVFYDGDECLGCARIV